MNTIPNNNCTGKELPVFVRDLLAPVPHRGGGLNNWLYRVSRVMHPFRSDEEIVQTLTAGTAGEPMQHGEIARAVERSKATAWQPGESIAQPVARTRRTVNGSLNVEQREAVTASGLGLADLRKMSPVCFEDGESHTEQIVDALFPGDPLLCVGKYSYLFATMSARIGRTQEGKESEHTLENTGSRRFLVIEQDGGTTDEQAAGLLHLAKSAPLASREDERSHL